MHLSLRNARGLGYPRYVVWSCSDDRLQWRGGRGADCAAAAISSLAGSLAVSLGSVRGISEKLHKARRLRPIQSENSTRALTIFCQLGILPSVTQPVTQPTRRSAISLGSRVALAGHGWISAKRVRDAAATSRTRADAGTASRPNRCPLVDLCGTLARGAPSTLSIPQ